MRLHDRVSNCQLPFIVANGPNGTYRLEGVADLADEVRKCNLRYVLSDELVRLCIALAYSRGAKTLNCADLLHIPARSVWVEWCDKVHRAELAKYGFQSLDDPAVVCGNRGVLLSADDRGKEGRLKVFWSTGPNELDLCSSPLTVGFNLEATENPSVRTESRPIHRDLVVEDTREAGLGLLGRCFTFSFERSWTKYYDDYHLSDAELHAIERHALGTSAIDIPVLLVFFLLLSARNALPQRRVDLSKLNRARIRKGKQILQEHFEVLAPLLPDYLAVDSNAQRGGYRRSPRLHQVRGHLVRRGNALHWRIPHLRGNARLGIIKSRTVSWMFENRGATELQTSGSPRGN